ncbi:MAG: amidohydrolase [Acidobacteria bacterium]|nr:amidohydrolase [Acidobacteriota bacterium]
MTHTSPAGPRAARPGVVLALALALAAPAPASAAASHEPLPADLILLNADVVGVGPARSTRSAVAIRGGAIAFVGGETQAMALRGERTRVADLRGFTLLPGLTDAHGHVSALGFELTQVSLFDAKSEEDAAARVREAASKAPPGEWIRGRGWDQTRWPTNEFPGRASVDAAAPLHPVALFRVDGHALWLNSRALDVAGIGRETPDPAGGRIVRDAAGSPTGVLVDNAMRLVESHIPPADRAHAKQAIVLALNRCLDVGLTEVHDAGISTEEESIYKELAAAGDLPIRVYAMLGGTQRPVNDAFAEPPILGMGGDFFTLRAIKLGIDGALGSRGAALFEDYADAPGQRGLITREPAEIESIARQAIAKGFQVCVHAIGDRGNAGALDALTAALAGAPKGDYRFRIEHAQVLRLKDIPRFKASGIIPSMQPTHCTSDMRWAEARLGPKRIAGAYAWRKLLATGVPLPGGSDFPVESQNPFLGIYAAVTRQDRSGFPAGGWRPEERMTIGEALRAFTLDAAYAAFEEDRAGAIEAGRRADIVVLRSNPLTMPVSEILEAAPAAVLLAGRVVRTSPDVAGRLPVDASPRSPR